MVFWSSLWCGSRLAGDSDDLAEDQPATSATGAQTLSSPAAETALPGSPTTLPTSGHAQVSRVRFHDVAAPVDIRAVQPRNVTGVLNEIAIQVRHWTMNAQCSNPARLDTLRDRIEDTWRMLDYHDDEGFAFREMGEHLFAAMADGRPVGLVALDRPVPDTGHAMLLSAIVTVPDSRCGRTLIEQAVNCSEAQGRGGRLTLSPLSDSAELLFASLGFRRSHDHMMDLDPAQNPACWRKDGSRWLSQ